MWRRVIRPALVRIKRAGLKALWPLRYAREYGQPVTMRAARAASRRALVSYLLEPVLRGPRHPIFRTHTNAWESREIVRIFGDLGYDVDVIDCANTRYEPSRPYDVVFDTRTNLQRLAPLLPADTIKIFYAVGFYVGRRNGPDGELARVSALERRRGRRYAPKRLLRDPELIRRSLDLADHIVVTGNAVTRASFPQALQHKISSLVTISAAPSSAGKSPERYVPAQREFVWMFGEGLVHKGLDLVIEAVARQPSLKLNIFGRMERDFREIYREELAQPNIEFHGFHTPDSERFAHVVGRCVAFVAPSCSEGMSPACATLMGVGLLPIVSRQTGIDLPPGAGTYLEDCSIEEIERRLLDVKHMPEAELRAQITRTHRAASEAYSRDAFSARMRAALEAIVPS